MSVPQPHVPVLIEPLLKAVAPVRGVWIDGTLGGGGYAKALLSAGAERVIGIDRDPEVIAAAMGWGEPRLSVVEGRFGDLDLLARSEGADPVSGVVLDVGVSSMQLDRPERGFSFAKDGPLDMRMEKAGPSAADLVNTLPEEALADILHAYGEERAARRIAREIVRARGMGRIATTQRLAEIVAGCLPRPKPGQPNPATRSFQALRIAVNDELGELVRGLVAAERMLQQGGALAIVTFHSLEDRIVKRFLQIRSGNAPTGSRYLPEAAQFQPTFRLQERKAIEASLQEVEINPRARSAKLRVARREAGVPWPLDPAALGLPHVALRGGA